MAAPGTPPRSSADNSLAKLSSEVNQIIGPLAGGRQLSACNGQCPGLVLVVTGDPDFERFHSFILFSRNSASIVQNSAMSVSASRYS